MQRDRELIEAVIRAVEAGRRMAVCAVVRTRGSVPQAPGAMMVLDEGLQTRGTLGGGCVEAEVRKQAYGLLRDGKSGLLTFVLNHDYGWDDWTDFVPDKSVEAVLDVEIEQDGAPALYRVCFESRPTLLIAGAGHIGQALARLASDVDFRVVVVDDRADCCNAERFPTADELIVADIETTLREHPIDHATYITIVTRGHRHDEQALAVVLDRPARYIGLIGSRRKIKLIFDDLADAGADRAALERVHSPIGVAIDAVTVPEIAVSILAELIAVRRENKANRVTGPLPVEHAAASRS